MINIRKSQLSDVQISRLKVALTAKVPDFCNPVIVKNIFFFEEHEKYFRVPRFYIFSTISQEFTVDDDLLRYKQTAGLRYNGILQETPSRPQISAFNATVNHLRAKFGGLVVMAPGSGKTNLAIAIALHFGLKVMVVAHTDFLLSQWKQRITDFVSGDVKIGIIQQDVCESKNCDFVIASMQSLNSRTYPEESLRCGLLIVDEAHHIAAATFSKIVGIIPHYYSLGLTATPKRGDRLGHMVELLLGQKCFNMTIPVNGKVQVNMITYSFGQQKEIVYKNGLVGLSSMTTILTKDALRNKLLLDVINLLFLKFPTRKGLLLSARVDHLKQLYKNLDPSMCAIITGNVHSEMTKKERMIAKKNREEVRFNKFLTLSTFKMFSEAIDFDGDFIILATPKANVEQSTGRVLRGRDSKHMPLIFDIVDPFSSFDVWRWVRFNFYKKRGYEIICLKEHQIFHETKRTSPNQPKNRTPKRKQDTLL